MPIAIVFTGADVVPGIFKRDTDADLLKDLAGLQGAPALRDVVAAKEWLVSLPEPSGWFDTAKEALAHTERLKDQARAGGDEVKAARAALGGLGRDKFADLVGIGGNKNTRHKFIYEVEIGKTLLSIHATRSMRALLAQDGIENAVHDE